MDHLKGRISEIFVSVQGEGVYLGQTQKFIRFFGCDQACAFCDTQPLQYQEYTVDELLRVMEGPQLYEAVSLTGGEPLLQAVFIRSFLRGWPVPRPPIHLETNGISAGALHSVIDDIDVVAMDFKLPSVTRTRPFWREHAEFLRLACRKEVFVKIVVSHETAREDIQKAADLVKDVNPSVPVVLQPMWPRMDQELLKIATDMKDLLRDSGITDVRILPQAHKYAGMR